MSIVTRTVTVRKVVGKKVIKDKVYTYTYYTLPLNLYIPKSVIEKWGTEFVIERDNEKGTIVIKPKTQVSK